MAADPTSVGTGEVCAPTGVSTKVATEAGAGAGLGVGVGVEVQEVNILQRIYLPNGYNYLSSSYEFMQEIKDILQN